MKELLQSYNISDVIMILFIVLIAAKECIEIFKYFKGIIKGSIKKEDSYEENMDKLIEKVDTLYNKYDDTIQEMHSIKEDYNKHFKDQEEKLTILLNSDKDDIKGYIVEKHHQFISQGWIDDFSMDVLTKRFQHYQDEGGNSYAERLMNELDNLPKNPPQN